MNPEQFQQMLAQRQKQMRHYVYNVYPRRAGEISLRFIDQNFRLQGWQGATFQPWKPNRRKGTILVKSGELRRGNRFIPGQGVTHVFNDVRYAAVHNNGFKGPVNVRAHQRYLFEKKSRKIGTTEAVSGKRRVKTIHPLKAVVDVKAHTRKMNIPRRQFMPGSWNDSPVLAGQFITEMSAGIKGIFEPGTVNKNL